MNDLTKCQICKRIQGRPMPGKGVKCEEEDKIMSISWKMSIYHHSKKGKKLLI